MSYCQQIQEEYDKIQKIAKDIYNPNITKVELDRVLDETLNAIAVLKESMNFFKLRKIIIVLLNRQRIRLRVYVKSPSEDFTAIHNLSEVERQEIRIALKNSLHILLLNNIDISYTDLSMTDLTETVLNYSNLEGINLSKSCLNLVGFESTNLKNANLSGIVAERASFIGAELMGSDLSNSVLSEASFADADLSGANLSSAKLDSTSFHGANLQGANLAGTDLNKVFLLYRAKYDDSTIFPEGFDPEAAGMEKINS